MAKVFVTGGAGYIGSHTCKVLAEHGYNPIVYDNLCRGHREFVKWGPLIEGDIEDFSALDKAIAASKPNVIVHFAALAYVHESFQYPALYYKTNVIGTLNLIEAMIKNGVTSIVFSSSCAVYGLPLTTFITEEHPKNPINPYGFTKKIGEQALQDIGDAHGLSSICLRYFNAAGADMSGELGEKHSPETHVIPLAIQAALKKNGEFSIYGNDYLTHDGSPIRDYVHVTDLATAHVLAVTKLLHDPKSVSLNIGSGNGVSVIELVKTIEKISQQSLPITFKERRRGDPDMLIADITRAKEILGWSPVYSDINNIIENAWQWHKKYS